MKKALANRRKSRVRRRIRKRKKGITTKDMEDLFYMYSEDDLPEIEADLFDHEVKPEISRDYYL